MSDYERIAKAIIYIESRVEIQPTLDQISGHVNMSSLDFQRMFCRWTGVTPKKYLQILTVERAKRLLAMSKPLVEVSDTLELNSGFRLGDYCLNFEAVTPGRFKKQGEGLSIKHGVHQTPFGFVFVGVTPRGICQFSFMEKAKEVGDHLMILRRRWPMADVSEGALETKKIVNRVFSNDKLFDKPLSLHVLGTHFQVSVWHALLQIPQGQLCSYGQVATRIGKPKASRAVGTAIGANPIAFIIPCHRVVQKNGSLGGYHWGETRKHAIHAWESARHECLFK